jgi:S-adenosylmethionine hydrolase
VDAREVCAPQFRRQTVSATFHGRDIFGPAAAHVAAGLDYRLLGPPMAGVMALPPFRGFPGERGSLRGEVIHVDRYGNLVTTIRAAQLFPAFEVVVNGHVVDRHVRTFSDAPSGSPFCHADSSGFVAVAMNRGVAAAALGARRGDAVVVRPL